MTRLEASSRQRRLPARLAGAAVATLAAVACTYQPGYGENPIQRSLAWFSYLDAQDLRESCRPGLDRYRIVYNGNRHEQVRTYDITASPGGGASLQVRVFQSSPDVSVIELTDPLGPWRGTSAQRQISQAELEAIRDGLARSGFDQPPPKGTRIRSWSFYWLAAACEDGELKFNAWAHGTPRFDRVALRGPLMAVDPTGVPFNPPREDVYLDRDQRERRDYYELVITPEGIRHLFTPF